MADELLKCPSESDLGPYKSLLTGDETIERVQRVRGFCLDHVSCDLDTVRAVLALALHETEHAIRNRGNR